MRMRLHSPNDQLSSNPNMKLEGRMLHAEDMMTPCIWYFSQSITIAKCQAIYKR